MTTLSPEEMDSLREQIGSKPPVGQSPSHALVRDTDLQGVTRRIEDAMPFLRDAIEESLSARTHRPWTMRAQAVRTEPIANLVASVSSPSMGICQNGPLVMMDFNAAQRFVALLLGVEADDSPPTSEVLGALDRQVLARLLKGLADDVGAGLAAAGERAVGPASVEHGWRGVAERLGSMVVVIPIEIEDPMQIRIDIVIPVSTLEASAPSTGSIAAHVENIDVDVSVELGTFSLALGALAGLERDTVLPLQNTEATPLIVYVQGERRFVGRPQATADGRVQVTLIDDPQRHGP